MRINKVTKIFTASTSISSAAILIALAYVLSAFFGFVRSRLFATYFGDSVELGIFYMADKLPSFLFSLIVLTTVTSAFIPIHAKYKRKGKEEEALFSSNLLNSLFTIYVVLSLIIFLFAKPLGAFLGLGSLSEKELSFLATLIRLIVVSQVFLVISTFFSAHLQSYKRFVLPAFLPFIYNLSIIVTVSTLHKKWGVSSIVYGMMLGYILGIILQIWVLKGKFKYHFKLDIFSKGNKEVYKLVAPRLFGVFGYRFYTLLLGITIPKIYQSPSYLVIYEFANQLQTMPVNIFGMALSQALMPSLSEYIAEDNKSKVIKTLKKYVIQMSYFLIPVSVLFIVLRIPLVRLLFGGDRFSWLGTNLTAYTLTFFSLSIWFQAISLVLTKVYYSLEDSRIPTVINIITMFLSLIISFVFSLGLNYGVWSFALAFSLGAIVNTGLLYYYLTKEFGSFLNELISPLLKMLYSASISGISIYIGLKYLEKFVFDTTHTVPLFILTSLVTILGLTIYLNIGSILGLQEHKIIYRKMKKLLNKV